MDKGGIYHSVYDSIYWYNHFSDGAHVYGQALSQFTVTALMRLADSDILPFEFGHFASTVSGYLQEIEHEAAGNGEKLDFAALRQELQDLKVNSDSYEAALKTAMSKGSLDRQQVAKLNTILMHTERALTTPQGLPNRPWYKHEIYAPGLLTGYGAKTLPGIREAVDAKQWQIATEQTRIVTNCLAAFNSEVKRATQEVQGL
jgi:N-acetylated-alpha-linked acidic dipeptidase